MKKIKYIGKPAETIEETAKAMIALAKKHNCSVRSTFNERKLRAEPYYNVSTIIKKRELDQQKTLKRWVKSDEYKKEESELAIEIKQNKERATYLIKQLGKLNVTNKLQLINWLCELQKSSEYEKLDSKTIVKVLSTFSNGHYYPCTDRTEHLEDKDDVGRWIITEALETLKTTQMFPQQIQYLAKQWKQKFFPQ